MKPFILMSTLLTATAAPAGHELCEPLARALTQNHFDALVWNAKNSPDPSSRKYLACEGQKVRLERVTPKPAPFGSYLFLYDYAIECGPNTFRFGHGYYMKPKLNPELRYECELQGE